MIGPNSKYLPRKREDGIRVCIGRSTELYELYGCEGFAYPSEEGDMYEFLVDGYRLEDDGHRYRVHRHHLVFLNKRK